MQAQQFERPWYRQWNYLVICLLLLLSPFLVLPGQKPLLCLVAIVTALWMQGDPRLRIVGEKKPPELIFFTLWALWAVGTGSVVAENRIMFRDGVMQMTRMVVMLWAFMAIFYRQKNCTYLYYALIAVALVQVLASMLGIQLDVGELALVRSTGAAATSRTAGMTGNANTMGFVMLSSIWGCIMLWQSESVKRSGCVGRLVLLCLIVLFSHYIIQTASRKSLLVAVILLFAWFVWLIPGRFSFKSVFIASAASLLLVIVGVVVFGYIMKDTYMGQRLLQWSDAGRGSLSAGFRENVRYLLYVEGWNMFLEHPIAGIGLSQFAHHFFNLYYVELYSHSDYMEPLACTGLVGFILYHGFAFSVTLRLIRLLRCQLPDTISYIIKGMLLFMIANHYLIGLGCPHWNITDHNMVVLFIGVYAWKVWKIGVLRQPLYLV